MQVNDREAIVMATSEYLTESCCSKVLIPVKKKLWPCVKLTVPGVLIIGVWSALSLPIVFHNLPKSEISSDTSGANTSVSSSICSAPLQYATTNGICLTEFANILISSNCPLDAEGGVLVMRNEEATATQVINGFKSNQASDECISKVSLFLCLHLLGLCGELGVSIQPTISQCEEIRDSLCQQQWILIQRLNIGLPDCSKFPAEASLCKSTNEILVTNKSDIVDKLPNNATQTVLECTEGFYQENGSNICTPSCYTWMQNSQGVSIYGDVVIFISLFFAFLVNILVILISCLGHKRMLVYPAIFIVYMTIDGLVLGIFTMVGYMGRDRLFCSSTSLIESMMKVTPFCVISGMVAIYTFCQTLLWWLFYVTTLFWHVIFPFHAQIFEATGKNKYIHITCITLGILLPLVPIIAVMADFAVDVQKQNGNSNSQLRNSLFLSGGLGFEPRTFPTSLCFGSDSDTTFYSIILMLNIMIALGCSLLIIIFSSLYKAHIKRREMQIIDFGKSGHQFRFGKAEKKLAIVLCYFVVLAIIYPLPFFLSDRNFAQYFEIFQKYFMCEQGGRNPSQPCSRPNVQSHGEEIFGILTFILSSLFPLMNLLYAVNIQELKKLRSKVHGLIMSHLYF